MVQGIQIRQGQAGVGWRLCVGRWHPQPLPQHSSGRFVGGDRSTMELPRWGRGSLWGAGRGPGGCKSTFYSFPMAFHGFSCDSMEILDEFRTYRWQRWIEFRLGMFVTPWAGKSSGRTLRCSQTWLENLLFTWQFSWEIICRFRMCGISNKPREKLLAMGFVARFLFPSLGCTTCFP